MRDWKTLAGRVPLWCWWIPVVWAISLPWDLTWYPQWDRVNWVPFSHAADRPRDLIANIVLFVPFGYSFVRQRRGSARVLMAVAAAILVSVSAEATQLFGTARFPSATDVTAAVAGVLGGAWLAGRGRKRDERPKPS